MDNLNWFDWVLIAWFALGALTMIGLVGKPRKPIEPSTAVIGLLINAAFILGVVFFR